MKKPRVKATQTEMFDGQDLGAKDQSDQGLCQAAFEKLSRLLKQAVAGGWKPTPREGIEK